MPDLPCLDAEHFLKIYNQYNLYKFITSATYSLFHKVLQEAAPFPLPSEVLLD